MKLKKNNATTQTTQKSVYLQRIKNLKKMIKPYLKQFERQLISLKTFTGACILFEFRIRQLEKSIINKLTLKK